MTEHRSTYDPVWDALGELRDSNVVADTRAYADARYERVLGRRHFWQRLVPMASAGLATAAACFVLFLYAGQTADPVIEPIAYSTAIGEIREQKLPDGSIVVLDTNTRLIARFTAGERRLTLLSGQGHFNVAHNAKRPFIVSFGRNSVTALGTSFDVTALPGQNAVTLLSGKVRVTAKSQDAKRPHEVTLTPGLRVAISDNGQLAAPRKIDPASASVWQHGQLDLSDMPVSSALSLMNRYSTTRIVVREPDVLGNKISGIFKAGDTTAAVDALTTYFNLRILSRSQDEIVLGR